jgi:hypothetical protein
VLTEAYGFRPVYHVVRNERGLRGVLPVLEVSSWLTGRRGIGLPFTDECVPVGWDEGWCQAAFDAAVVHGRDQGWKYLELRGGFGLSGAPVSTAFWGHRLRLEADEPTLLAGLESSVRRAIRKAEQSEIVIEFSRDLLSLRQFYCLLCQTRKKHGVPPQPWSFFASIHRQVLAAGHGWIVLARHRGKPVAGAVFFQGGRIAIYKYGASDAAHQDLRANNLVMWAAIKRFAREGFAELDFGRTSMFNAGLRRFKLGWGAREVPIEYCRFDLRREAFVAVPDAAAGWHNRVFRLMPVPLARLAGRLLYPHVA